jgi:hypothetical protein
VKYRLLNFDSMYNIHEIRRRFLTLRSQTDQDIPTGRAVINGLGCNIRI